MRSRPDVTPAKLFHQIVILHAFFTSSVLLYVIVGELIAWGQSPFDGFASDSGPSPWVLRIIFLGMSAFEVLIVLVLFRTNRFITAKLTGYVEITTPIVLEAIMNRPLSTAAPIASIGVYGLVLFLYGGDRLDLYTFCAVSLALLVLLWPRRLQWEVMFREFAAKHPGVPSNPWQPELSAH